MQLIEQYNCMLEIIGECGSEGALLVHPNAVYYMKCMACMLTLNYEQLDIELGESSEGRFVTHSDEILINYFEIMRLFREVQVNPQGEGVF